MSVTLIDRKLSVDEMKDRISLYDGKKLVCEHVREEDHAGKRTMLPAHTREHARWRHTRKEPTVRPEEASMRAAFAPLVGMFDALKPRLGGRSTRPLQTDEEADPEP